MSDEMGRTERDFDERPYSADEQRIAEFLFECGVGGGDDPVGYILASHAYLAAERKRYMAFATSHTEGVSLTEVVPDDKKTPEDKANG